MGVLFDGKLQAVSFGALEASPCRLNVLGPDTVEIEALVDIDVELFAGLRVGNFIIAGQVIGGTVQLAGPRGHDVYQTGIQLLADTTARFKKVQRPSPLAGV